MICDYTTLKVDTILLSFYYYLYHYYQALNNYQ